MPLKMQVPNIFFAFWQQNLPKPIKLSKIKNLTWEVSEDSDRRSHDVTMSGDPRLEVRPEVRVMVLLRSGFRETPAW